MTGKNKYPQLKFSERLLGVLLLPGSLWAASDPAMLVHYIMEKVAVNQDRGLEARSSFVYQQNLLIRFKRSDGKACREEIREFTVTPSANGTRKTLVHFAGKYLKDRSYVEYTQPGYAYKGVDLDGALITSFADDFANDQGSRDGIDTDMFPLTTPEQEKYVFTLKGKERYRNREVFRITFQPLPLRAGQSNGRGLEKEEGSWSGEVLVDSSDYQPVVVTTHLARGIPFWVKTLLGTDVTHLGFKVEYEKFEDNLWFPVEYGGEFKLKALFFYKRNMAIALHNHGFQRSSVTTVLTYDDPFSISTEVPATDSH